MFTKRFVLVAACTALTALLGAPPGGAAEGSLQGRLLTGDGDGLGGVVVSIGELGLRRVSDGRGRFTFARVAEGVYTLELSMGEHSTRIVDVVVDEDTATRVEHTLDWKLSFAESLTVASASRRRERVVDAPAAVFALSQQEIERRSSVGELPRLLQFAPGAELAQGGVFEFNLNVRGYNDVLNRRILTLIDGRDPSVPSLGHQEWAAVTFPLDDLAGVELVRGPGSALYGADAFNGVLNLTTKAPRYSPGGRVRWTGGELDTSKLDVRHAAELGGGWSAKLTGGHATSEDFAVSRTTSVEYSRPCTAPGASDCLPLEAVGRLADDNEVWYASLRFDRDSHRGTSLVLEAGTAELDGPIGVTEFGRLQLTDVERPWARANLTSAHWNLSGSYTAREGREQTFLSVGYPFFTDSSRVGVEAQAHSSFADGRGFAVGGASAMEESVDSAGPDGVQTVTYRARDEDFQALFGQVEFDLTPKLVGLVAARWDETSLHDSQFSPRASLVYSLTPAQTLRLSFSEAFLTPNYSQLFMYLPAASPLDLSPFETICALGGVSCGFDRPIAVRIVGNEDLEPEAIRSFELGYSAMLGDRTLLDVELYDNRIEDFISDFIPYVHPSFGGRLHDGYTPYLPPTELAAPLAEMLMFSLQSVLPPEILASLSTGVYGEPFVPLLSVANFGRVDTRGFEISLDHTFARHWSVDADYAWFDFEIAEVLPQDPLLPNAAEHKLGFGVTYRGEHFDATLKARYSDAFEWSAGVFRGRVPSYEVVDLFANLPLSERVKLGLDVSNLLDDVHYELFGGDLLGRRALVSIAVGW